MIQLQLLYQYALRHGLSAPQGFMNTVATLIIDLDVKGKFLRSTKETLHLQVPRTDNGRTTNVVPRLCDNSEYTFGVPAKNAKSPTRNAKFREFLAEVQEASQDAGLGAVMAYLEKHPQGPLEKYDAGNIAFRVDGKLVYQSKDVVEFFRLYGDSEPKTDTCRITGVRCNPPATHPKISNLPEKGASTSSTLVSFNTSSSEYHGLEQAANYPLCMDVVVGYTDALNYFLSNTDQRRHRQAARIGNDYITVIWTQDGRDLTHYLNVLDPYPPRDLTREQYIEAIKKIKAEAKAFLETQYEQGELVYALTMKAHKGRIGIYGWETLPLGKLARNLVQFQSETNTSLRHLVTLMHPYMSREGGEEKKASKTNDGLFNPDVVHTVLTGSKWSPRVVSYVYAGRIPSLTWVNTLARNIMRRAAA